MMESGRGPRTGINEVERLGTNPKKPSHVEKKNTKGVGEGEKKRKKNGSHEDVARNAWTLGDCQFRHRGKQDKGGTWL